MSNGSREGRRAANSRTEAPDQSSPLGPRSDDAASSFNVDEVLSRRSDRKATRLPRLVKEAFSIASAAGRRELVHASILQLTSGAAVAVQVLLTARLLDKLLSDDGAELRTMLPELALLAVVTAFIAFANIARTERQRVLGELVAKYAAERVISTANSRELIAYEDPEFHDRLQRASLNAAARPLQMTNGVLGTIGSVPAIGGIAVALLALQPVFFFMMVVAYVPTWLATRFASRSTYEYSVRQTERDRRRTYFYLVMTRREEAAEIRAFGMTPWLKERFEDLYDERIADLRQVSRRRLRIGLAGGIASSVLMMASMAFLVWMVTTDRTSLATAGAVAGAIVLLGQRLQLLVGSIGSLFESSLFLEDFTSFVADSAELPDSRPVDPLPSETVSLRGVDFSYPAADRLALDGVSLEIQPGQVVAIVGENGSGKTTLAKVLSGLYRPDAGSVDWGSTSFAELAADQVRSSVTLVLQDYARFHLTAFENIGVGRTSALADRDGVRRAAERAGALEAIESLPAGFETWLGPEFYGGADLSIGQWQRVALARAFFRDSPLLILDEPTSALDPRAEADLFGRIRQLFRGRSVLLISHRFSTVKPADRIYVMHKGRVVESGSHDELMALRGVYAELYEIQAASLLEAAK